MGAVLEFLAIALMVIVLVIAAASLLVAMLVPLAKLRAGRRSRRGRDVPTA